MTPQTARDFADSLQERVTQMGDRTGEGQYLGQCLGIIRDLAAQLDAAQKDAHDHDLPVSGADPVEAAEPEDGVHVVRVADNAAEAGAGPETVTRESILEL